MTILVTVVRPGVYLKSFFSGFKNISVGNLDFFLTALNGVIPFCLDLLNFELASYSNR